METSPECAMDRMLLLFFKDPEHVDGVVDRRIGAGSSRSGQSAALQGSGAAGPPCHRAESD